MNGDGAIRRMEEGDLPDADALRHLAGWNQTLADWRRLLRHEPEGCFVAEKAGRIAGVATTTRHGSDLAWIGMVLVHPDFRRQGIGRALLRFSLAHLDAFGCRCVKLDATPAGKPLYASLGFQEEWPLARWEGAPPEDLAAEGWVRPWAARDREAAARLDDAAFGASRASWLDRLLEASVAVVAEARGQLASFGMRRPGARAAYLGPVVAESTEAGRAIALALLAGAKGQTVYWDIPEAAGEASALAARLGFRRQRPLLRMFRGENARPGIPSRQFAIADPATG